jgi:hypothetical protein
VEHRLEGGDAATEIPRVAHEANRDLVMESNDELCQPNFGPSATAGADLAAARILS